MFSPTRLIFQYMTALTNCGGLKSLIVLKIIDIIIYLGRHGKEAPYGGSGIHYLYNHQDMIGDPTNLNYSGWNYHSFYIKTNTLSVSLVPVIASLRGGKGNICECWGLPRHKYNYCIIIGENFLPPSLRGNKNQSNEIHGYAPHVPPK